jgi:DNA modification methylase
MKPYFETELGRLYHGDCLEIMPRLEPVDLVLTDPPYGMHWNFSGQGSGKKAQGGKKSQFKAAKIIGDSAEFNPSHLLKYSTVIIWGFYHFPQYLSRGTILIWPKKYRDAFGSFLSDGDAAWMNRGNGVYISPTINPATFQKERVHPTQKPVSLMIWCIEKSKTNGLVLDPYAGSGTTAVACEQLNRRWIGIEISEKYCEIAAKRIEQENQQLKLFG